MSRTIRTTPEGDTTRDGSTTRGDRRPLLTTRRQGTRSAVVAAAIADLET
jgi:hypothetical protein